MNSFHFTLHEFSTLKVISGNVKESWSDAIGHQENSNVEEKDDFLPLNYYDVTLYCRK